jgi:hypothetical protein
LNSDLNLRIEAYYQDLYNVPVFMNQSGSGTDPTYSAINVNFGLVNSPSTNAGTGENYGVDLTLEKFFTRNYYFVINASIFESNYTAADGIKRSTRYDAGFVNSIVAGKEFQVGKNKNNLVGLNFRSFISGNNRVTPIDIAQSESSGETIFIKELSYSQSLPIYMRMDVGFSFRKNKVNRSNILSINIQNVTNRLNARDHYYNSQIKDLEFEEQLGMFPNLSYRIEF